MAACAASDDARRIALDILDELDKGRATLDRLMEKALGSHAHLQRRDRALVFALTYGVQRWRRRLDWVAAHFASRPFSRIDPTIRNILRLALFQILFFSRVPPAAAVHTAVEMTKVKVRHAAPFVNALLRNALRHRAQVPFPDPAKDPVAALGVEVSFPDWIVARWIARDGAAATRARCEAANLIPLLTVRVNTLKIDRDRLSATWGARGLDVRPTLMAPEGIVVGGFQGAVDTLAGFAEGYFQVQDEAAQLAGLILAPEPGERILDACAGLGGKTGHLAALAADRARIVATDQSPDRLAALQIEMRRLGVCGVETRIADWTAAPAPKDEPAFDKILIDAPCSGLGVLGRNPDARWHRQQGDLDRCARRQQIILANLAGLLKPGGILVYVVCSIEPEESIDVIGTFLQQRPDYTLSAPPTPLVSRIGRLIRADGAIQTDPGRDPLDGFYMVCLKRAKRV